MVKIKLGDIVNSASPKLNEDGTVKEESLLAQLQTVKFPVKVSYRIKRLIDRLDPIIKAYNEKRNDLVKEFGEEQEDKTVRVTDPVKLQLFYEKLSELLTSEEEVEFEKLKVDELGDVEVSSNLLISFIFE